MEGNWEIGIFDDEEGTGEGGTISTLHVCHHATGVTIVAKIVSYDDDHVVDAIVRDDLGLPTPAIRRLFLKLHAVYRSGFRSDLGESYFSDTVVLHDFIQDYYDSFDGPRLTQLVERAFRSYFA